MQHGGVARGSPPRDGGAGAQVVENCCPDASCGIPQLCSFPQEWYRCNCGVGSSYCVCAFNNNRCYTGGCP